MKITIEVNPLYADCITFTAIGHGNGYTCNVATGTFSLHETTHFKMIMDDEIHCHFEQEQEK